MAECTLSTSVSRRSMLGGGAVALVVPMIPRSAIAASPEGGQGGDHELLRRIGVAENCLAAYRQADAEALLLHEAVRRHPDFPDGMPRDPAQWDRWDAFLDRIGTPAADDRCERLHARYEEALAAVFAVAAGTLPGVHGKLRLAVTKISREQEAGFDFDDVDCGYLDGTLADLARLAVRRD